LRRRLPTYAIALALASVCALIVAARVEPERAAGDAGEVAGAPILTGATGPAGASPRRSLPASPYPAGAGGWVFPLFPVTHVVARSWWSSDQGVDLGGTADQCGRHLLELAVASGTIVREGLEGFGEQAPVLRVDSGPDKGRFIYYGHAFPVLEPVGTHVSAGQPIAEVGCGRVGISTAPHLEIGMLPAGAGSPEDLPAIGETAPETLLKLTSAYRSALSASRAERAVAAAARRRALIAARWVSLAVQLR